MGLVQLEEKGFWCASGVREKVCVLAQAIAGPLDLDDDRVVKEPIEERGGDNRRIAGRSSRPAGEAAVRGEEDHGFLSYRALTSWKNRFPPPETTGHPISSTMSRAKRQKYRMRSRSAPSRSAFAREAMMSASELK